MTSNPFFNWIEETLNRLFIKQPKYFKYWTWLSMILMVVSGIPYLLQQVHNIWPSFKLPDAIVLLSNKFVSGASLAMLWMSKLVVKSPIVGKTDEGHAIHVTNEEKMPFTTNSEKKDIEKQKPPVQEMPEVPEAPKEEI